VNVSFGTGFNPLAPPSPLTTDARASLAAPAQAEDQDSTSFVPVDEPTQGADARQGADGRQGEEARQVTEQVRAKKAERRDERASQADEKKERRLDDRADDRRVAEQRAQDRAEQAQRTQELQQLRQLAERDREVRAHEQAHQAVGGQYAGPMSLQYERGPDGKNYAVSGEVSISIGEVPNDPQATLDKAETVRRAALAPAEPSAQDRRVAAQATQIALEAQTEIQSLQREEQLTKEDDVEEDDTAKSVSEEEREDQRQAREKALAENDDTPVVGDLQALNDRLSKIQAELQEISQFDDKVKASTNLLDASV